MNKATRTLKEGFNIYSPEDHKQLSWVDRARICTIYENAAEDDGLERVYAEHAYDDRLGAPHFVVYMSGGELVSCCLVRQSGNAYPLSWVHTEPSHRRKRYASKIIFSRAVRGITGYATRETEDFFIQWLERHLRKGVYSC